MPPEVKVPYFPIVYPDRISAVPIHPLLRESTRVDTIYPERTSSLFALWYPDQILGAPPRKDYETDARFPIVFIPTYFSMAFQDQILLPARGRDHQTEVGFPERTSPIAAQIYPDQVLGPPPRKDYFTEVGRPERTTPIAASSYPDRVLGAPPRKDYQTEVGFPERTSPLVTTVYPDQVLGAPPRKDYETDARFPERKSSYFSTSYPDQIPPVLPRQYTYATEPGAPETRLANDFYASYPDRVLAAPSVSQQRETASTLPPRPERTSPLSIQVYPDRIVRVPPTPDFYTEQGFPITVTPTPNKGYTVYPDSILRVGGMQTHQQQFFTGPVRPERTSPIAIQVYPDRIDRAVIPTAALMHVGSLSPRPERTSLLVSSSFPDQILLPARGRDHWTEDGKPERTVPLFSVVYADRIDLPLPRQHTDATERPMAPERTSPFVSSSFPDQILPPGRGRDFFTEDGKPERTTPFSIQVYPDRIDPPLSRQHTDFLERPLAVGQFTFFGTLYPDRFALQARIADQSGFIAVIAPTVLTSYPERIQTRSQTTEHQETTIELQVLPVNEVYSERINPSRRGFEHQETTIELQVLPVTTVYADRSIVRPRAIEILQPVGKPERQTTFFSLDYPNRLDRITFNPTFEYIHIFISFPVPPPPPPPIAGGEVELIAYLQTVSNWEINKPTVFSVEFLDLLLSSRIETGILSSDIFGDMATRVERKMFRGDTLAFLDQVYQDITTLVLFTVPVTNPITPPPSGAVPYNLTGVHVTFSLKNNIADPDAAAIMELDNQALGGVTVLSAVQGTINVIGPAQNTIQYPDSDVKLYFDIQIKTAAGNIFTVESGTLFLDPDITRAPN